MSKEKQIEEMANATMKHCEIDNQCGSCHLPTCNECMSEFLYNAGYRKQSEGEWVDQYNGKYDNPIYVCSLCRKGTLLTPEIDNLGNMKMIQALSPFCPNCGAHMKGGAE